MWSLGRACGRRLQSTRVGRAGRGATLRPGGRARWRAGTVARRGGPWVRQFEFGLGSYRHRNRTGATTMSSSPRRGRAGLWGLGVSGRACEAMSGAAGVGVRPQLAACICGPRASRLCGAVFFSQPARKGARPLLLKARETRRRADVAGGSGLLNTGIKVIHHELSEVQPDYSSFPPCAEACAWVGVFGEC